MKFWFLLLSAVLVHADVVEVTTTGSTMSELEKTAQKQAEEKYQGMILSQLDSCKNISLAVYESSYSTMKLSTKNIRKTPKGYEATSTFDIDVADKNYVTAISKRCEREKNRLARIKEKNNQTKKFDNFIHTFQPYAGISFLDSVGYELGMMYNDWLIKYSWENSSLIAIQSIGIQYSLHGLFFGYDYVVNETIDAPYTGDLATQSFTLGVEISVVGFHGLLGSPIRAILSNVEYGVTYKVFNDNLFINSSKDAQTSLIIGYYLRVFF